MLVAQNLLVEPQNRAVEIQNIKSDFPLQPLMISLCKEPIQVPKTPSENPD